MKTYISKKISFRTFVLLPFLFLIISCTDVNDDGINTVIWEGSVLPQDSCYRNPVWEPDLSYPSVFEAAVGYFAVGTDNEWSPGLHYTAPVLSSNDLMNWRLRGEGFTQKPDWAEGKIDRISAAFAKTKGTYFVFYTLGNNRIGMAGSKAPQGPYTDFGILFSAGDMEFNSCSNPFFFPYGSRAYLFFKGDDGFYGIELTLERDKLATLKGEKFKIAGNHFSSINVIRWNGVYYLFGVVEDGSNSIITTSRAFDVTGPYLDKENQNIMESEGTITLQGSIDEGFISTNHIGGVFEDSMGQLWILYHAIDTDKPILSSGHDRHPLLLSQLKFDEDLWPASITSTKGGWNYPKFSK